jgi:COP9 signalosome complex subunit 6
MLHSRIKLVLEYVKDVQDGKLKPNQEILREAFTLSHRLPVVQNPSFKEEFHTQSNDVGLITYLGSLTKASNDINQLVNKFNLLHDRQSRRMRFFF